MMTHRYPESSWTSGLERATGSSSSTEAWEGRIDPSGRLFYIETPPEPNWDEIKVNLPIENRRGVNYGRKAGFAEKLLGLRVGRGGVVEAILVDGAEQLIHEGDVVHRVEGIPVQDRAGIEMTLSGLAPGAQSVRLHLLRRSLKVEEVDQTPLRQPPDFPHQLLYFQPGAREAYKFPESPPAAISGAFPTLHDALDNSFNSGASVTSITFEQQLHSVSYAQLDSGGLLCVAVSADIVPLPLIGSMVAQLRQVVAAEFGPSNSLDRAIEQRRAGVDAFFSRFFHSLRAEPPDTRALSLPRLTLLADAVKVKLDTVLYRFEACELEDGAYVRTHHVLGGAIFAHDGIVCSHLQRPHLELVFLLLRQERVLNTGDVARTIIWRPIHLPERVAAGGSSGADATTADADRREGSPEDSTEAPATFLLVVSRGPFVLASLLEVNDFCIHDGNPAPDPFLVDWADENLTIVKNVLVNVGPIVLENFIVLDETRGFYVADKQRHDTELWTFLRRRRLSNCLMGKASDGGYMACQRIDGVVVVNRQDKPLYTIEHAIKAIRTIEL
ncbi:hypothetical protein BIW11_09819 [Tropilaelaps mercedesae]|uniref:CCZ1/INTU second Longin domain-containing protein n=1 Tax=Tropilaelaps mercedesae TaxID=418985 RepID=A0A1V9XIG5_9ACAR|nr:hypothetical protein BIW11_09819 [Tropilaelaps mercedesae]